MTIAREYGSGGADIGRKVAELLGLECVDNQIIGIQCRSRRRAAKATSGCSERGLSGRGRSASQCLPKCPCESGQSGDSSFPRSAIVFVLWILPTDGRASFSERLTGLPTSTSVQPNENPLPKHDASGRWNRLRSRWYTYSRRKV